MKQIKSRLIEFGKFVQENAKRKGTKAATFTFLGFTHYCSSSKSGRFRVKRKTSRKKFSKKCKEINTLLKRIRHWKIKDIVIKLNQILVGYYHYYGITDNIRSIMKFRYRVYKSLYYWLNHGSQKRSYTWEGYDEMMKAYPFARPKIYVSVYA